MIQHFGIHKHIVRSDHERKSIVQVDIFTYVAQVDGERRRCQRHSGFRPSFTFNGYEFTLSDG